VVDLAHLEATLKDQTGQRAEALAALAAAASKGFLYIKGTALTPERMDAFVAFVTESMASLAETERAAVAMRAGGPLRGLTALGKAEGRVARGVGWWHTDSRPLAALDAPCPGAESTATVMGSGTYEDHCFKYTW
jgi:isopenicillin N synthase-like dioxygenase